jgi:iron(III) transport system substrate-binding protein
MTTKSLTIGRRRRRLSGLTLVGVLLVSSCGSDSSTAPPATIAGPSATAGDVATTAAPTGDASATTEAATAETTADTAASGEVPEWQALLTTLQDMPMDELYKHAIDDEGGSVIYWNGNSVIPADRVAAGPAFEAAYPGMHVTLFGEGATPDMIARLKAEQDAGLQPSGDVLWASMEHATVALQEGILAKWEAPEAAAYPDELKSPYYVIVNQTFHGIAWNTDKVSADEAPKTLEDILDPKWKGRIIAEPRIATQLTAFAAHRFADDAAARDFATKLAAQDITFIPRYPTLVQSLASGEHDICFNCNLFNAWELINDGAPIQYMQTEAMSLPDAQMIIANPIHPYGAMLIARWMISADGGQPVLAAGGKSPTNPDFTGQEIAPAPVKQYRLLPDDVLKVFPTWDDYSTDLFKLR